MTLSDKVYFGGGRGREGVDGCEEHFSSQKPKESKKRDSNLDPSSREEELSGDLDPCTQLASEN